MQGVRARLRVAAGRRGAKVFVASRNAPRSRLSASCRAAWRETVRSEQKHATLRPACAARGSWREGVRSEQQHARLRLRRPVPQPAHYVLAHRRRPVSSPGATACARSAATRVECSARAASTHACSSSPASSGPRQSASGGRRLARRDVRRRRPPYRSHSAGRSSCARRAPAPRADRARGAAPTPRCAAPCAHPTGSARATAARRAGRGRARRGAAPARPAAPGPADVPAAGPSFARPRLELAEQPDRDHHEPIVRSPSPAGRMRMFRPPHSKSVHNVTTPFVRT